MLTILLLLLVSLASTDSVCDKKLLIAELKQDLADNGRLDCLREIKNVYGYQETELEKNRRLAAQWDSDCSFEANDIWREDLFNEFEISSFVSVNGDVMENDDEQ